MARVNLDSVGISDGVVSLSPVGNPLYVKTSSETTGFVKGEDLVPRQLEFRYYDRKTIWFRDAVYDRVAVPAGTLITINGEVFSADDDAEGINQFFSCTTDESQQAATIASLADAINSNAALSYKLYAVPTTRRIRVQTLYLVELRSKLPGTGNEIEVTSSIPDTILVSSSVRDPHRAAKLDSYEYKHYIQVWIDNQREPPVLNAKAVPGEAEIVSTLELPLTQLNQAVFDISEYLRPYLAVGPPTVSPQPSAVLAPNAHIRYGITYGEQFSGGFDPVTTLPDNPENKRIKRYQIGAKWDLFAGIGGEPLYAEPINYISRYSGVIKPMSNAPEYRLIRRGVETIDPLYFWVVGLLRDKLFTLRWRVTYVFKNGGTLTRDYSLISARANGLYLCDASYASLQVRSAELERGADLLYLEAILQIDKGEGYQTLSSITRGMDDNVNDQRYEPIMFKNRLGVYECFTFEGERSTSVQDSRTNYRRSLSTSGGVSLNRHVLATYRSEQAERVTYNSGWIDEAHSVWLQELTSSPEVYRVKEYNGVDYWEAIRITESSVQRSTADELFNVAITAEPSTPINTIK